MYVFVFLYSWVKKFGEHNGLDILLDTMRGCSQGNIAGKDAILRRIQHQCVRCLKAFMNNKVHSITDRQFVLLSSPNTLSPIPSQHA